MAAPKTKTETKNVLPPRNFSSNEFTSNTYRAIIPTGHTKEMLENPNYWCHIASKLRRHYEIICVAEDFSFYGRGLVTDSNSASARVWMVTWTERTEGETEVSDPSELYKISSNANGFRIIHKETGKLMKENIGTRKEAVEYMASLADK